MKAIFLTQHFQTADQITLPLVERPLPKIETGQCLVQVYSSGINPSDALGAIGYFSHAKLPRIPGRDYAGIIVDGPHKGRKVWGTGGTAGLDSDGTHAEYLVIPEEAAAEIPRNLSLLQAGAQTLPYVTAYYSLVKRAAMKAGETVLVIGALGQVGHAAMSLCKWKRCKPIALVRGQEALVAAKNMGWEAYETVPDMQFDVVLNTVGNVYWDQLVPKMNKFGRHIVIAAMEGKREALINFFTFYRGNETLIGVNTVDLDFTASAQLLNEMKPGFESNILAPLAFDPPLPFAEAAKAYKTVLAKGRSRIVLQISP